MTRKPLSVLVIGFGAGRIRARLIGREREQFSLNGFGICLRERSEEAEQFSVTDIGAKRLSSLQELSEGGVRPSVQCVDGQMGETRPRARSRMEDSDIKVIKRQGIEIFSP